MSKSYWLNDEDQSGNFSNKKKDTFDPAKRYVGIRLQQGVPLLDRDWNELEDIRRYEEQMLRKWYIGNGTPDDGFRISAVDPAANDFKISAGRCLVDGFEAVNEPYHYVPLFSITNDELKVDEETIPDTLKERFKTENVKLSDKGTIKKVNDNEWLITSNEDTYSIRKEKDTLNVYLVNFILYSQQKSVDNKISDLKPPENIREDTVYLDVWIEEIGEDKDERLKNSDDVKVETCVRHKIMWLVRVDEGSEGNYKRNPEPFHHYYDIARIKRKKSEDIQSNDIQDLREKKSFSKLNVLENGNVGIGTTDPQAKLEVSGGAIRPAAGDSDKAGIMFPKDPFGGSGDAAWIRYYRRGKTGENTTLEIGTSDNKRDHIALMASGNVGIGTDNPGEKLEVDGNIKFTGDNLKTNALDRITPIYIRGTGFNNPANRILRIGSTTVYDENGRGLHLTILKKVDHSIEFNGIYDTFGKTDDSKNLENKLKAITKDQIGILTSYDMWEQNIDVNLEAAFQRVGLIKAMSTPKSPEYSKNRHPYAAIFEPGSDEQVSKAIEVLYNNSKKEPYAEIRGWLIDGSFVGSGSAQSYLVNNLGNKTSVVVSEDGNVGIGTPAPKNKLDVKGSAVIGATYSGTKDAPTNGLLIEGNVGIGTTEPNAKLHISGGEDDPGSLIIGSVRIEGRENGFHFKEGDLSKDGYCQVHGILHNESLKELMVPKSITDLSVDEALNTLKDLKSKKFKYKIDKDKKTYVGFIADDAPDLVTTDKKSLGVMNIVSVLTSVVQSQQEKINQLQQLQQLQLLQQLQQLQLLQRLQLLKKNNNDLNSLLLKLEENKIHTLDWNVIKDDYYKQVKIILRQLNKLPPSEDKLPPLEQLQDIFKYLNILQNALEILSSLQVIEEKAEHHHGKTACMETIYEILIGILNKLPQKDDLKKLNDELEKLHAQLNIIIKW